MFYRKNLYSWEQVARVVAGLAMAVGALWALPGEWMGYGLGAMGGAFALTGVFGFCPMCAMLGRRPIARPSSSESGR